LPNGIKKEGEHIQSGELLVEVATDKAVVEYNALDEGYLRKILVSNGAHAKVNQPIAIFTEKADEPIGSYRPEGAAQEEPLKKKEPPIAIPTQQVPMDSLKQVVASPLAKKLAKEKGLDLRAIKGSGPRGRVTSRDLNLTPTRQTAISGSYEEVPLTPMRKVIAQRLQQAKSSIPHIYLRQEIDAVPLFEAREQLKKGNVKVTFNDFAIRASALALREHPQANSGFDAAKQSILLFKTVDISIAVTVEGGLITPIIRHADQKNLGEISLEAKELATRARAGKLKPEEYQGGSFTLSNMGMLGISDFAAIINPPQAAILAIGGIEECAQIKNGNVIAGKKMNLVLSADHRVLDGAEAAQFLKSIQKYLENPVLLLI